MKAVIKIILFLTLSIPVIGQNVILKGKIVSQTGDFLEHVNIQDKKSGNGVISNQNGEYELVLPKTTYC